ncbi:hypothetical protein [Burkholderia pseudomallei]|uniref:hypothetical protein n=1 Tax=Burkholderia pseudomallei TaxID=28450 RepID=UPI000A884D72|nr:hypothetical protein [Burkholderia pseudomallei]
MKSDSAIFSFIENFPTSASLKTADTGKYIANNIHNSIQFGINNPKDLEGLTIQDVKFNQKDWGIRYAQLIQDLDRSARKPTFPLLQSLAVVAFAEIVIYVIFVWIPNYFYVYLGIASFYARLSNISSLIIFSISMTCAGYAERYFCARNIALFGTVATAISVYPSFCAYLIELTHFIAAPAIYIFLMGMLAAAAIYKIYPPSKTKFRYRAPNSV